MKIVVNYLNVVFHIELKTKFNDKFGISFFSLSKTRNRNGYTDYYPYFCLLHFNEEVLSIQSNTFIFLFLLFSSNNITYE